MRDYYVDVAGQHRWRLVDGNSQVVAGPQEGYSSEQAVERAWDNVIVEVMKVAFSECLDVDYDAIVKGADPADIIAFLAELDEALERAHP